MEGIQDTIFIMEQYNFNAPINVKIIYEDDDEETSERIITHRKNAQADIRQRGNGPSIAVESNLDTQAQMQTFNQINSNVDNELLNLVIDNMSGIVRVQFKFQQINKKLNIAEIERFKVKYIEMKYFSFKRLMRAAKFVLIPQKRNELFIQNIIAKIIQKAKVNRNIYSKVRSLYDDLVAWTEQKLATEEKDVEAQKNLSLIVPSNNTANFCHRKRKYPCNDIQQTNASREMLTDNRCQMKAQSTEQNRYPLFVNNPSSSLIYYPSNLTTYYNAPENYLSKINSPNSAISVQEQHHVTRTFVANSTIDHQETMQSRISQSLVDNSSHLERNAADRQDISRSSISRDSGFMSPELVFSPQESTVIYL